MLPVMLDDIAAGITPAGKVPVSCAEATSPVDESNTTVESSAIISPMILPAVSWFSTLSWLTHASLNCLLNDPKFQAISVLGSRLPCIAPPITSISLPAPSPKLMLPLALIVPVILILPVPVILLPFKSSSPPSCGEVSASNASIVPAIEVVPPAVVPSPMYSCLVSVTYINSPAKGVMPNRSAFVPRLTCKAI